MISYLDKSVELKDVYFFDDVIHDIDGELTSANLVSHSIIISPPFTRNQPDSTYYDIIQRVLSKLESPKSATPAYATPVAVSAPGPLTIKRSANVSALPPTREFGRNRSGAFNNADPFASPNNSPPNNSPPLAAIRHTPASHSSLFNAFPQLKRPRNSSSGGRRKSRRKSLKKHRNKTRNRLRK